MRTIVGMVLSIAVLALAVEPATAKPKLSLGDVTVSESAGMAEVPVTLSKKISRKVRFSFQTGDAEALAGVDYEAVSGSGKIAPRKRTATISVPLRNDPNDDYDRYFNVGLVSAKRAKPADHPAKVTITDDDPAPTVSVSTDVIAEGGFSGHEIEVTVSEVSYKLIDMTWSATSGSATAGEDFQAIGSAFPIGPGERSHTFTLFTLDDAIDEFDETFSITLFNVREATTSEASHQVTITDDDPAPTVSLSTPSVAEGTSGTVPHQISVALSGPSGKPIAVGYATAAGTATSPADFTATAGQLAFAPGDASETFNLTTVGDYDDEPDETVGVTLSAPVNLTLPASPQSVVITDDDVPCQAPDLPASQILLGSLNGDAGTPSITRNDAISPCGDSDWFGFTLNESSSSDVDLHARVFLTSNLNDSPQGGDVDLCVRISGNTGSEVCSESAGGGVDERVDICVDDTFPAGTDETTQFQVEVDGFGNAVNSYQLAIMGNSVIGAGPTLHVGAC